MPANTLPISRLIDVQVILAPQAAQAQSLDALLILGDSNVIDTVELIRTYNSIDEVAADFGTSAPEYFAALLWFSQSPQPNILKIGRWAKTATMGELVCGPLSATNLLPLTWNQISNGQMAISVDGANQNITALDFSAAANLSAVAAIIDAKVSGCTVTYDSVYTRFVFESASTGPASSVSYITDLGGGGTNIGTMLVGEQGDGGAYLVPGIAAQTPVAAVAQFDEFFGQTWYGLMVVNTDDNPSQLAVADYIEAANNKHMYGIASTDAGCISSVSTTDIAFETSARNYKRTVVQYSSTNAYSVASALGRLLTTDYNGQNTVITVMYKQEPTIVPENLSATQATSLQNKSANALVAYNNNTAILQYGTMASGDFMDEIAGTDWLAVTIMTAIYNLLYTSLTKIPQTDPGVHQIVNAIENVCSQGVTNGLLAPGVWNSNGFGTLKPNTLLAAGFYVYAPSVNTQLQADREARKSPVIQVAAKLAGAIHTVDVLIFVNR